MAFRAGQVSASQWDEDNVGHASVALGFSTKASGAASLALNNGTEASGEHSIAGGIASIANGPASLAVGDHVVASGARAVAFGHETVASGVSSFAAGENAKATGPGSAALGVETQAGGSYALAAGFGTQARGAFSIATGTGTVAAGAASVALGSGVTAQGDGSFVFGDRNIDNATVAGPNQFAVRAQGGIGFTSGVGTGCDLGPNSGAWACASSKLVKEEFQEVDGEDLLARLQGVPIQSWRYIGTSARHIGPFAEDFRAAFGLGDSPTRIAQIDADGVALGAVRALDRRTAELRAENAALRAEATELRADNTTLRAETTELRRRVEALELSGRHQMPR